MKYGSVFSGIEAATVAWHGLGWQPVFYSEIDPFPCAVLAHHYPTVPNLGDIKQHGGWTHEPIDLLVGGSPCQSFSVAGLRKGLDDPRGSLMLTFLGVVERCRPRFVVWENVPGVLSSNGGRDFGALLGALGYLGYGWSYRVLDAQWFGIPQRRRRVFVVACAGDQRAAAAVLFEQESLRRDLAPRWPEGQAAAGNSTEGSARGCWWDGGQVSQTLDAVLAKGQAMPEKNRFPAVLQPHAFHSTGGTHGLNAQPDISPPIKVGSARGIPSPPAVVASSMQVRRLTPRECERLQGFPDDHTSIPYRGRPAPDGPRYKALGNSMAVPVMRWIGQRIDRIA